MTQNTIPTQRPHPNETEPELIWFNEGDMTGWPLGDEVEIDGTVRSERFTVADACHLLKTFAGVMTAVPVAADRIKVIYETGHIRTWVGFPHTPNDITTTDVEALRSHGLRNLTAVQENALIEWLFTQADQAGGRVQELRASALLVAMVTPSRNA
ncbi:hypothetical protein KIH74_25445 [Kineosporia sp. J2-2]|uniref:Uncharacterized protein n=1 Tax=Kineosporia corallincola TaxID=2835133 RepID=A0ABS5TMS6_9ACTN|nr:hypothetical protein [Kineosporia corallincola]MBT0772315.1 hypothetical protein [Kineosporia corallincola]